MKKIRTLCALLLSFLLSFTVACSKPAETESSPEAQNPTVSETDAKLQLLYCSKDTLNPFHTKNKSNFELSGLMYEPLVDLSDSFEPVLILAEDISFEENVYTVKIKDALFSDNTSVTAEDVLSSYLLAKESTLYSPLLYEVNSAIAVDAKTVSFELSKLDPYFANLLTFPIIKKGSDELKNEDNIELAPIGSGKYVFSEEESALLANPNYIGEKPLERISLVDAPDMESVQHYVEIGATDYYYTDPADGTIVRMSGKKSTLNMNNLFYIGINHSYGSLSNPKLRQVISSAINRDEIAKTAFYGYARSANGFFHPEWQEVSGYQTLQQNGDTKISIENLEEIGYNNLDKDGIRVNANNNKLTFSLLVNDSNKERISAAELIREQLAAVGIGINITAVSDSQYFSALSLGQFQLYLGEVSLTPNMDISNLVLEGKSAAYGIKNVETLTEEDGTTATFDHSEIIKRYYKGESSISEVATALINHMPVVPVVYRSALLFYSDNIAGLSDSFQSEFFSSVRFTK